MEKSELDKYREIVPDKAFSRIRTITREDMQSLNKQTGFNRSLLEASRVCGCFHCGRKFPTHLVTKWMTESGEEDTGLCPYCGEDALVVGTKTHPLSTALLTALYEEWFEQERDEREAEATELPFFKNYNDYLRKGIPFLWSERANRSKMAEMVIWSIGDPGEGNYDCEGADMPGVYTDVPLGGVWHLRAWEEEVDDGLSEEEIEALDDEEFWSRVDVIEHFELERDGTVVRFTPWSGADQAKLISLYKEYKDMLLAIFKNGGFSKIEVFVDRANDIL